MKEQDRKDYSENIPFASEMLRESNWAKQLLIKTVVFQWVVIVGLISGIIGLGVYHNKLWAEFDTVIVDSGEGGGYANYFGGSNTGDVNNGTSGSEKTTERKEQGDAVQTP